MWSYSRAVVTVRESALTLSIMSFSSFEPSVVPVTKIKSPDLKPSWEMIFYETLRVFDPLSADSEIPTMLLLVFPKAFNCWRLKSLFTLKDIL